VGDLALQIETELPVTELREQLAAWQPWSALIAFSNGVTTAEFDRLFPFAESPLYKVSRVEGRIPFEELPGGSILDIGCNAGYNCIYLNRKYGMRVTGIDVQSRLVEAASFLADLAGVEAEFTVAHAESFVREEAFDVVLNFGTLYHLQNPLRALQASFLNLRPGGLLALETQCYDEPGDDRLCYFIQDLNNDPSNFFALSTATVVKCLEMLGFAEIDECFRHETGVGDRAHMYRVCFVARKAAVPRDLSRAWPPWAPLT
jgi:2-polyprenyl-3-methyl-5-hydroxy-6-metoxy-1,4-benzoquinol methylase